MLAFWGEILGTEYTGNQGAGFIHDAANASQNKQPFKSDCICIQDLMRDRGCLSPLDRATSLHLHTQEDFQVLGNNCQRIIP